jgi:hypothetical protein
MTALGSIAANNVSSNGTLFMFGSAGVAGGASTIVVTLTGGTQPAIGNSVSYNGVTSVATAVTNFGGVATATTGALTCSANQMIVSAFYTGGAITSPAGGTTRYNGGTNLYDELLIQDSTASTTFTATLANATWGGISMVLL